MTSHGSRHVNKTARKVALVTGGAIRLGRAIALELARQGADVVIAEMDQAGAKRTAEEVGALGRRSLATTTDVTSRADLRARWTARRPSSDASTS